MKKIITLIAILAIAFGTQAQDYNKWSVDIKAGLNKPVTSFSMTPKYRTTTPSPWNVGIGARYMLNTKFGVRFGFDYDSFTNADDSPEFDSKMMTFSVQGVSNLGRILNFEAWTKKMGLFSHVGVGYARLTSDNFSGSDNAISLHAGLSPQYKISNKVSLFLDVAVQANGLQDHNFDGKSLADGIGIQGINYTASLGVNIYLGKNEEHADWFYEMTEEEKLGLRIDDLEKEVASLKGKVANNETVSTANKEALEGLKNNVENTYAKKSDVSNNNIDVAKELINKGYVNVYFGFNKTQPNSYSVQAVDFVVEYLKKHTSSSVEVLGYADEIGKDNYNQKLSAKRSAVVKQLLVDAGIAESRINAQGKGVDKSVNKDSENARQIARRVTFRVK